MGNTSDESGPFLWQSSHVAKSLSTVKMLPPGHLLQGLQAALMLQAEVYILEVHLPLPDYWIIIIASTIQPNLKKNKHLLSLAQVAGTPAFALVDVQNNSEACGASLKKLALAFSDLCSMFGEGLFSAIRKFCDCHFLTACLELASGYWYYWIQFLYYL